MAAHVAEALAEVVDDGTVARALHRRTATQAEQTQPRGGVERDPDREGARQPEDRHQEPGERRAQHAGGVHASHRERHGVLQPALADDVDHDGRARRHREGEDRADHGGRGDQVPELEPTRHQQQQHGALREDQRSLAEQDETTPLEAIGDDAAEGRPQHHRDGDGEVHEAEIEGAARELEGHHRAHQHLPLHGEEERHVAGEEPAVLRVLERGERGAHPAGGGGGRGERAGTGHGPGTFGGAASDGSLTTRELLLRRAGAATPIA